jgi:hypothetical protein
VLFKPRTSPRVHSYQTQRCHLAKLTASYPHGEKPRAAPRGPERGWLPQRLLQSGSDHLPALGAVDQPLTTATRTLQEELALERSSSRCNLSVKLAKFRQHSFPGE